MVRATTPEARKAALEAARAERAARRRVHQYPLRLNAAERGALEAAAAGRGVTPADYLRASFLGPFLGPGAPLQGHTPPPAVDLATVAALNRVGANLNQIARRINAGDIVQPGELPAVLGDIAATLGRIETLVFASIEP